MLLSKRNCIDLSGVGTWDRGSLMANQQKVFRNLSSFTIPSGADMQKVYGLASEKLEHKKRVKVPIASAA